MGQDFFRRIDGYNFPFHEKVSTQITSGASVVVNAPAGPGRIESIILMVHAPAVQHFINDNVVVVVDGSTIYTGGVWLFGGVSYVAGGTSFSGPVRSWRYDVNVTEHLQALMNLDYESSASVTLASLTVDNRYNAIVINGRVGR